MGVAMQLVLYFGRDGVLGPVLRLQPGRYFVGRDPDCQIRLPQRSISRRHCLLAVGPDWATVRDLESRNRTHLNAREVAGEEPLRDGDQLAVCGAAFRVRVLDAAARAEPAWVTVPPAKPGVVFDGRPAASPEGPLPAAEGDRPAGVTLVSGTGDLAPGVYDLPLDIPGYDLTLQLDLKHFLGRGTFGQVWWARTRGTSRDWRDGVVKVSHHRNGSVVAGLSRWGAMAAARVPCHPGLLLPRMVFSFAGRPPPIAGRESTMSRCPSVQATNLAD